MAHYVYNYFTGKGIAPCWGITIGALVTCELLNAFHTIEYVMLYVAVFI